MTIDLIRHLESWRISQGGDKGMGEPALELPIGNIAIVRTPNGERRAFLRLDDLIAAVKADGT